LRSRHTLKTDLGKMSLQVVKAGILKLYSLKSRLALGLGCLSKAAATLITWQTIVTTRPKVRDKCHWNKGGIGA